jgi:hypothetical protein
VDFWLGYGTVWDLLRIQRRSSIAALDFDEEIVGFRTGISEDLAT